MKKKKSNPDPGRLRVLILEDKPADAELIERELRRAGIVFTSRLVDGKRKYSKALADFQPQVILADFKLPLFDGLAALKITRLRAPDTPFIFVSGSIGEEKAIELLAQGASDYILKDTLQRLGPAVKRVIEATCLKLEKKKSDEELQRYIDELQLLAEAADRFVHINDLDELYDYLAQTIRDLSGADYLRLSLYDEKLQVVRPKIVTGFEPFQETIHRRFHIDLMEMVFYLKDMRQDDFSDFVSRRLIPVRDGLYGLANRKIPRSTCRLIEKLLAVGSMHTMGFSWENQLFGRLTVFFKKANKLKNASQIEALANLAAVSIKRLLVEQALRESEEKYRLNFEYSPLGLFSFDEKGVIVACNDNFVKIIGSSRDVLIGLNMLNLPDKNIASAVQKALSGSQGFYEGLYSSVTAKKITPVRCRFALINVEGGGISGGVGIIEDISERKRAETIQQIQYTIANAAATAETFFSLCETVRKELSALLDTTNFLVALYDEASGMLSAPFEKDEKDAIPQWSAEKSLTGLVLKQKHSLLLRGEEIRQLDEAGSTEQIGSNAEAWLGVPLQINEKVLGAIVVQSYNNADAYDQNSVKIMEMIASQLSVYIERKRAEEELLREKAFLEKLVETAPEGIAITDCPGRILQVNNEFVNMFGYEAEEAVGKNIDDLIVPSEYLEEAGAITRSVGAGKPNILETVRKKKDGTLFNVSIIGSPIHIAERQVAAVYAIYRDISERKRAESQREAALEELRISAEKWQTTFDSITDIVSVISPDHMFLEINKAGCDAMGLKREDIIGKKCYELVHHLHNPLTGCPCSLTIKSKKMEVNEVLENGRYYQLTAWPILDANGELLAFSHTVKDISDRKRAEEQIQYQASLLQNVSDAIIATDKNSNIQAWNKAAEKIYDWKAEETIGKKLHDVITPEYRYQSREEVIEKLEKEGAWSGEIIHHRRDGNPLIVQSSIKILKDAAGDKVGMVSVNHDISERKLAEKDLQDAHDRLAATIKAVPDLLFEVDRSGRIFDYHAPKIGALYVTPEKFLDKTVDDILPTEAAHVIHEALNEAFQNGSHRGAVYKLDLPDGPAWFELSIASKGQTGRPDSHFVATAHDISERKRAEEQIRASLKEKEVLLQEIHHRVKNNLQIISGLLTLQADQSAGKSLAEIFQASQDRIHSIALIHEKLYQSHNLAEIAFDEYLHALTENLFRSHGIAAGRITARYEMEPILFTIEKAIPLGLIVNELVTNALKYAFPAGRQGEICITLHECRDMPPFSVADKSHPPKSVDDLSCPSGDKSRRAPIYELIVADNGVGLPAGQIPEQQKSLGMKLVSMLAKQIQAELKVKTGPGTEFRLLFSGLPANETAKDKGHGG